MLSIRHVCTGHRIAFLPSLLQVSRVLPYVRLEAWTLPALGGNLLSLLGNTSRTRQCRNRLRVAKAPATTTRTPHRRTFWTIRPCCQQLARDVAHQCRDELRRARHTSVIHYCPRRLRCVGQDTSTPVGRGPYDAGPSVGTLPGRGVVRKRQKRNCDAASAVWNDLLPRNSATSPRDEHLGERRSEAAPLVGQTCRNRASHVVRPLHEAIRNIENLEPRRHCLPSAGLPLSAPHYCTERGCKRRDNSAVCKKAANSTTQSWPACRACSSNSCRCSCSVCKPLARPLRAPRWRQYRSIQDASGLARHTKKRAVVGYKLRALLRNWLMPFWLKDKPFFLCVCCKLCNDGHSVLERWGTPLPSTSSLPLWPLGWGGSAGVASGKRSSTRRCPRARRRGARAEAGGAEAGLGQCVGPSQPCRCSRKACC